MDASAGATLTRHAARRPARGFSMVELLVTIVLPASSLRPWWVFVIMERTLHDALRLTFGTSPKARLCRLGYELQ